MNPAYNNGDFVIVKDHINLPGLGALNPLKGLCDDRCLISFPVHFFSRDLFISVVVVLVVVVKVVSTKGCHFVVVVWLVVPLIPNNLRERAD